MAADPTNLQFTMPELLAEIGAKQLVIQRLTARIEELEALLTEPAARTLKPVPTDETNGVRSKG